MIFLNNLYYTLFYIFIKSDLKTKDGYKLRGISHI